MNAVIIGLGGMGKQAAGLLEVLARESGLKDTKFLAIDIDPAAQEAAPGQVFSLGLRNVSRALHAFKERADFNEWWIPNYIPNPPQDRIEGNTAANQIRIHGRLALYAKLDDFVNFIQNIVQFSKTDRIYFFIISSWGGGTGAGIFLDVAAIIRVLYPQARIYGFFLDGTVTHKIVEIDTGTYNTLLNSYAALMELLHFMVHPDAYSFGNYRLDKGQKIYDLCFLYQHKNTEDYTFVEKDLLTLKRNYINLVVNSIYPIIAVPNFENSIIGNTFTNAFDNLSGKARELCFTGVGVGKITFSRDKIAEYFLCSLVESLLESNTHTEIPTYNELENRLNFEIKTLKQELNQTPARDFIFVQQLPKIERKLIDNAYNNDYLRKKAPIHLPIITKTGIPEIISKSLAEHEKVTKQKLDLKLMQVKKEIDAIIDSHLYDLTNLLKRLEEYLGSLSVRIEKLDKLLSDNISIAELTESWSAIFAVKPKIFGIRLNAKRRNKVSEYVKKYEKFLKNEFDKIENQIIKDFYKNLREYIKIRQNTLEYLISIKNTLIKSFANLRGRIIWRDKPLDEYRLKNKEYPLEIKIDVNMDIIDRFIFPKKIKSFLEGKKTRFRKDFIEGFSKSGKNYNGLRDFYKEILDSLQADKEKKIEIDFMVERIKEAILSWKEEIKEQLNDITIQDMLYWWLGEILYPRAKELVDKKMEEDLTKLANDWKIIFGDDSSRLTDIKDQIWSLPEDEIKAEWIKRALNLCIKEFFRYVKPFVNYSEHDNQNKRLQLVSSMQDSKFKMVFCPVTEENLAHSIDIHEWRYETSNLPSSSILIYSQDLWVSPHSLIDYDNFRGINIKSIYKKHLDTVLRSLNRNEDIIEIPRHIDVRFYKSWCKITGDAGLQEFIYILIAISFGLGIIKRTKFRGKKKVFVFGDIKLGDSLPKLMEFLQDPSNYEIKESLKRIVYQELQKKYLASNNDFNVIEEVFKAAYRKIRQEKLDTSKEGKELLKFVEFDPSGFRTTNNRMPISWEDIRIIFENF